MADTKEGATLSGSSPHGSSQRASALAPVEVRPIGIIRTPFVEKVQAPRQAAAARGVEGRIELLPGMGFEHALENLEEWDHLWILFLFHLNTGWKPKILPPRSTEKRGLFSTRSPYRPNPIGMSVVRLASVEGLTVNVLDVDMLDGTPVLDIKPYVPYADSIPNASSGWLETSQPADPEPGYSVEISPHAATELAWLVEHHGVELERPLTEALKLGIEPHPYRRIRTHANGTSVIAIKAWRIHFRAEARHVTVLSIHSGYGAHDLAHGTEPELDVHRAFIACWGTDA